MASAATEKFEKYLVDQFAAALRELDPAVAADVYLIALQIGAEDDDPRRMIVELRYNTNEHYESCLPKVDEQGETQASLASGPAEARWNPAFWIQKRLVAIGVEDSDEVGCSLRDDWLEEQGLSFSDEDQEEDDERAEELGESTVSEFWDLVTRVAKRMHQSELIVSCFGKPIPVIVHDAGVSDESFDATSAANPRGLTADFLKGW